MTKPQLASLPLFLSAKDLCSQLDWEQEGQPAQVDGDCLGFSMERPVLWEPLRLGKLGQLLISSGRLPLGDVGLLLWLASNGKEGP